MDSLLGVRELYEVTLKATYDMSTQQKNYKQGEVVGRFDSLQIANLSESKKYVSARGGQGNDELVVWDDTQFVSLRFSQGIFSKSQLGIMMNSSMITEEPGKKIYVPHYFTGTTDIDGNVELQKVPVGEIFVCNLDTGKPITEYQIDGKLLKLGRSPITVGVDYYSEYTSGATIIATGEPFIQGFLKLEGKTRLKDDETGKTVTGILTIPKLKLKSGLSMQLGQQGAPMVATFYGEGYPVGSKGHKVASTLTILNDDIDSDF